MSFQLIGIFWLRLWRRLPAAAAAALFCVEPFSSVGQIQQAWVARYNNGVPAGQHVATKMILDAAGNVYICGSSQNTNGGTGYATLKYASNGTLLWSARYDSTNYSAAQPLGFSLDRVGDAVVTGTGVTAKYSPSGSQEWVAPYNALSVTTDSNLNVALTGVSSNFETLKLDSSGNTLWTVTDPGLGYQGPQNLAQSIQADAQGDLYVAGSLIAFSSGPKYSSVDAAAAIENRFL